MPCAYFYYYLRCAIHSVYQNHPYDKNKYPLASTIAVFLTLRQILKYKYWKDNINKNSKLLLVRQAGHLEIRVYFGIKLDISNDISLYQLIIRNVRSHKFYGILENSIHQKYKIRFVEID